MSRLPENSPPDKGEYREAGRGLTPRLRFPEFREAGEWEENTLGGAATFINGRAYKQEELLDKGKYRVLRVGNFFSNNQWYYSDLELDADKYCDNGDLLYAWSASFGPKIWNSNKTIYHYHIWKVIEKNGIDKKFLFILLDYETEKMKAQSSNGLGLQHITKAAIESWLCCFPKIEEQKKIASCLTSLDELITLETQKLGALKSHKKGLMQQLFPADETTPPLRGTPPLKGGEIAGKQNSPPDKGEYREAGRGLTPRLRFPEFREAGEWVMKKLGKVSENLDNRRVPITSSDREAGDVPYYGASGIVDYVKSFIFDEDLLCVSEDGANLVARTYPIAFPISGKTWVNNHAHVLRFENTCTQKFVEVYLNSIKLDDFITGMAQPKLNKAMLDSIPIPYPDVPEQQRIADCLSSLDNLITAQTKKIAALKTHKQGLMQLLFPSIEETGA